MVSVPEPMKEVIGGGILLEGTKIVLFGEPKTYKSLLAEQLAFCLSTGNPWVGFKTEQSVVGYVQAEVPRPMFRIRTLKMGRNLTVPHGFLNFATQRNLKFDRDSGFDELYKACNKIRPTVLIVDPIYKFTSGSEEPTLLRFVDNMDKLIDDFGLSVVLIHHSRKPRSTAQGAIIDMGGSELRGPIIEQWADGIIRIRGDLNTDDRTLDFELRHAETMIQPTDIKLDRKRLWFDRV